MMRLYAGHFIKRLGKIHSTMESSYMVFVSDAYAKLFPDNTLSTFTIFFAQASEYGGPIGGCQLKKI